MQNEPDLPNMGKTHAVPLVGNNRDPVHVITHYLFTIHLNIIFSLMLTSLKCHLHFRIPN
jgi:hypothetical protein